jgi:hypothetical protein
MAGQLDAKAATAAPTIHFVIEKLFSAGVGVYARLVAALHSPARSRRKSVIRISIP